MKTTKQIISFASGIDQKKAENILPIKNAKMTYNFSFADGALTAGIGFEKLSFPWLSIEQAEALSQSLVQAGVASAIFYFRKYDFDELKWADKLIVFDKNLNAYYIDIFSEDACLLPMNIRFSSQPFGVSYRLNSEDVFFLASETDNMLVWDGVNPIEVVADAPHISSMAIHFERLFVTTAGDRSEMWFSDDLDPTNWNVSLNDAGFIQMVDERGSLRKVISFNNYLYVFRDFGISRLSASSSQESFFLSHLFVSSGKIFEKTITVCGDRIIFLTTDGLYQFDGSSTTKILENLSNILEGSLESSSCFLNGKYYLSCRVDFEDEYYDDNNKITNALFVLDVVSREYEIVRGLGFGSVLAVLFEKDPLVIVTTDNPSLPIVVAATGFGNISSLPLKKVWRSAFSDLGYSNKSKTLRKLHATIEGSATITITSESESISLTLSKGVNSYPILISGKQFLFEFYSEDNEVSISNLMLDFNI